MSRKVEQDCAEDETHIEGVFVVSISCKLPCFELVIMHDLAVGNGQIGKNTSNVHNGSPDVTATITKKALVD